jgi:hypothetical protein
MRYDAADSAKRFFEFAAWLGYPQSSRPGGAFLLALENCEPVNGQLVATPGRLDWYDDTLLLVSVDTQGVGSVRAWLGTTQPGRTPTLHPKNKNGCAHLVYGAHEYVRGKHKGNAALRGRNEVNRVWRDTNKNGLQDATDVLDEGPFGINIHAGGRQRNLVGDFSEGCLNVFGGTAIPWDSPNWVGFRDAVYSHLTPPARSIPLVLWRFSDLERWLQNLTSKPTLFPGTRGTRIAEMQHALTVMATRSAPNNSADWQAFVQAASRLTVDGEWGPKTTTAVIAAQRALGLSADGVCGPATWATFNS